MQVNQTCNDTGASLFARLSHDRGPGLIRRLEDYADKVAFV
jgi:hypothetical protein